MIGRGRGAVGDGGGRGGIAAERARGGGGGWGGGGGEGARGTRRHGDVATRRSGFRGGWKLCRVVRNWATLCRVVRNWATLCMSGSLGVFGRSKPISYKGFVFIALRAILRVPDQVSRVFERSRADESPPRFEMVNCGAGVVPLSWRSGKH